MPTFVFTSPEGKTYRVNGPEGATKEQAWGLLQSKLEGPLAPIAPEEDTPVISNEETDSQVSTPQTAPGMGDYAGAVPQTLYNLGVGAAGAVGGGLYGMYKLVESGMDWDQAAAAVEKAQELANVFRIEKSQSGQAIEQGIGHVIEGSEDYVAKNLEQLGMSPELARLTAKVGVEGGLALAPVAPKGVGAIVRGGKAAVRGAKGAGRALAESIAESDKPWLGKPVAPGEGGLQSGGPVQRVAPAPLADRVAAAAEARAAPPPAPKPKELPPMPVEPTAPPEAAARPTEAIPPTTLDRPLTKAEIKARDNTPYYKDNALSNIIDSPMLRAIKVTGGQDNSFVPALRKMETDIIVGKQQFLELEKKYASAVEALPTKVKAEYKDAILAGDREAAVKLLSRSREVKNVKNAEALMAEVRTGLDTRFKDVRGSGVKQKYEEGYHPRRVVDPEGFSKAFEKLMAEERAKGKRTGAELSGIEGMKADLRKLNDDLRASKITNEEYTKGIDKLLKSDVSRKVFAPKGAHSKERAFRNVPKALREYYADPHAALSEYFNDTARVVAERRFLGADPRDLEAGVAARISKDAATGRYSEAQLVEMKKILQERFNPKAQQAPSKALQELKNWGYAGTIANPLSAAVQTLDIIPAAMRYGVGNALSGAVRHVAGGKNRLAPKDLGLYEVVHELEATGQKFKMNRVSRDLLDAGLKYSAFRKIDQFGKGTILNAARNKARSLASSKRGIKTLEKKGWKQVHGADWDTFVADLKKGDWKNPNVQEFAIAELLDTQPIALSHMPINYLRHPNGRIFYMLKTWAMRQINAVRESWHAGRKVEATKLMAGLTASGIAAPHLREFVAWLLSPITEPLYGKRKQKEFDGFSDQTMASVLRALFLDTYTIKKVAQTGKASPLTGGLTTVPALDAIAGAIHWAATGESDKLRRYVPVIGPLLGEKSKL